MQAVWLVVVPDQSCHPKSCDQQLCHVDCKSTYHYLYGSYRVLGSVCTVKTVHRCLHLPRSNCFSYVAEGGA
jgi:hypothetical protein